MDIQTARLEALKIVIPAAEGVSFDRVIGIAEYLAYFILGGFEVEAPLKARKAVGAE